MNLRKDLQVQKFKINNKNIMILIGGYVLDTDDLEVFIYYDIDTEKEKHLFYNLNKKYFLYGTEKQITKKQADLLESKIIKLYS